MKIDQNFTRIRKIASNTRQWAEELQRTHQIWDSDLACMCGIASYELFKRLKKAGLSPTICFAENSYEGHAFIRCQGYTIDVTATQFGIKDKTVVMANRDAEAYKWFWVPIEKIKTKTGLLKKLAGWPRYQIHPDLTSRTGCEL